MSLTELEETSKFQLYPNLDPRILHLSDETKRRIIATLCSSLLYEAKRHHWSSNHCQFRVRAIANICGFDPAQPLTLEQIKLIFARYQSEYYGDDLSDNSDSEDNDFLDVSTRFKAIRNFQTPVFWDRTKRTSAGVGNVSFKVRELVTDLKKNEISNHDTIVDRIEKIRELLGKSVQARATLPYAELQTGLSIAQTQALRDINKIIAKSRGQAWSEEDVHAIRRLATEAKLFIAQYRGINYMLDRWNAPSRRYHYKMDEAGFPQYAEMVLRAAVGDIYTNLNLEHDYTKNFALQEKLKQQAEKLKTVLLQLRDQAWYCADYTDQAKSTFYFFNNILERFQHAYSNGIMDFLAELNYLRTNLSFYRENFPNAYNPFVSTGGTAYHALKYAFGLKLYYAESANPRWRTSGKLEYSHLGKVYMSLHRIDQLLLDEMPNNVPQMNREARVCLDRDIAPEKEISFLSFIDGQNVAQQTIAKFPDFSGEYLPIYEIKYGLSRELYEDFKYIVCRFPPNTIVRVGRDTRSTNGQVRHDAGIEDLITEWLCVYQEQMLMMLAMQKAKDQQGTLVYWGHDGLLTTEPDKGILSPGSDNYPLREQVHINRESRRLLGQQLIYKAAPHPSFGFRIVPSQLVNQEFGNIPSDTVAANIKRKQRSYASLTPQNVKNNLSQLTSWTYPLISPQKAKIHPNDTHIPIRSSLPQIALPQGLAIGNSTKDGNCFFDSIAQIINDGRTANELRQLSVNYIRDNQREFSGFFLNGIDGVIARITEMDGTLEHADEYEIRALSTILNRRILVISNNRMSVSYGPENLEPIFLYHQHEDLLIELDEPIQLGHYQPLFLIQNTNFQDILPQLQLRPESPSKPRDYRF